METVGEQHHTEQDSSDKQRDVSGGTRQRRKHLWRLQDERSPMFNTPLGALANRTNGPLTAYHAVIGRVSIDLAVGLTITKCAAA